MELKVAGVRYKIKIKELVDNDPATYGSCVYHDTHIELRKGLSKERAEQTLIHELLHAVLFEAGFKDDQEELVDRASILLHQVLKENDLPSLLEQVAEELEHYLLERYLKTN